MSRAQRLFDAHADVLLEGLVELVPRAHLDEQQHALVFILWSALAHADRVVDARSEAGSFKYSVDLARPKAHPGGIQHTVAIGNEAHFRTHTHPSKNKPAAEDYVSSRVWVHSDEVPVAPHAGISIVICFKEEGPVRVIAPEAHWDRRMWPCADELACCAAFRDIPPGLIENLDSHAEYPALYLTRVDGERGYRVHDYIITLWKQKEETKKVEHPHAPQMSVPPEQEAITKRSLNARCNHSNCGDVSTEPVDMTLRIASNLPTSPAYSPKLWRGERVWKRPLTVWEDPTALDL